MDNSIDTIMVLLVLMNLMLLGLSSLGTCIRVVAAQGITLGILPLVMHGGIFDIRLILFSAAIIGLKGIVFPWLLSWAMRDVNAQREVEPFIGYGKSVIAGPLALAVCMWLGSRLPLPLDIVSPMVVPVALFTIMCGLFLIVSRKKALTQVLGYLVLENGIYVFGASIATIQPVLVELGILLDAFVAVFVMGIAIYHINREFEHTDVDRLNKLKG